MKLLSLILTVILLANNGYAFNLGDHLKPTAQECAEMDAENQAFLDSMPEAELEEYRNKRQEAFLKWRNEQKDTENKEVIPFLVDLLNLGMSEQEAISAWIKRERYLHCSTL